MCDAGEEYADVETRVWRRARKDHRCVACKEIIRRGDRYHHWSSLFEGRWESWRHCARCIAICEALWKVTGESVDLELNCGETWQSAFGEEPPDSVARLAFMLPHEYAELIPGAPHAD